MDDLKARLFKCINLIRPTEELAEDIILIDNLLDSFDLVMLVLEIEARFGISINGEEVSRDNFLTIDTLADLIKRKIDEHR